MFFYLSWLPLLLIPCCFYNVHSLFVSLSSPLPSALFLLRLLFSCHSKSLTIFLQRNLSFYLPVWSISSFYTLLPKKLSFPFFLFFHKNIHTSGGCFFFSRHRPLFLAYAWMHNLVYQLHSVTCYPYDSSVNCSPSWSSFSWFAIYAAILSPFFLPYQHNRLSTKILCFYT